MENFSVPTTGPYLSAEKFKNAREKSLFTDIEFFVGTGDSGQVITAHRVFLACGSPVFEDMLFRHLYVEMNFTPIAIPDIQPQIFRSLLDHLYGIKVCFDSVQTAIEIHKVAERYSVPDLRKESELFICNDIQIQNVLSLLQMADDNFMPNLKQNCIEFIGSRFEDVSKLEGFYDITEENLESVLQMEDLHASEYQLLRIVARWETANKLTVKDRQESKSLIRYVRFEGFSVIDFCDFTTEYPSIIRTCDALQIVKHLRCPSRYELPCWCSRANSRMHTGTTITSRRSL